MVCDLVVVPYEYVVIAVINELIGVSFYEERKYIL